MLDEIHMRDRPQTLVQSMYTWFLRIMAAVCLVSGLIYWAQLTGLTSEGALRFDLMEVRWRVLSTVLAVVLPSAAMGLWMTQPWGVVLWIIALGMEISAYGVWAHLYAPRPMLVLGHSIALGFLVLLAIALFFERRRQRQMGF